MEINSQLILAIFASLVAAYIIYTVNEKTGKINGYFSSLSIRD